MRHHSNERSDAQSLQLRLWRSATPAAVNAVMSGQIRPTNTAESAVYGDTGWKREIRRGFCAPSPLIIHFMLSWRENLTETYHAAAKSLVCPPLVSGFCMTRRSQRQLACLRGFHQTYCQLVMIHCSIGASRH
jgi:hypothetical protein